MAEVANLPPPRPPEKVQGSIGVSGGYNTTNLPEGTHGFEDPNHPNANEDGFVPGDDRTHGGGFGLEFGPKFSSSPDQKGVRAFLGVAAAVSYLSGTKEVETYTPGHLGSAEDCPSVMGTPLCNGDADDDGTADGNLIDENSHGMFGTQVNFSRIRMGIRGPIGFNIKNRLDLYMTPELGFLFPTTDAYAVLGNNDDPEGTPTVDGLQKLGTSKEASLYVRLGLGARVFLSKYFAIGLEAGLEAGTLKFLPYDVTFGDTFVRSTPLRGFDTSLTATFFLPEPGRKTVADEGDSYPADDQESVPEVTEEPATSARPVSFSNNDEIARMITERAQTFNITPEVLLEECGLKRIDLDDNSRFVGTYTNGAVFEIDTETDLATLINDLACADCAAEAEPSPDESAVAIPAELAGDAAVSPASEETGADPEALRYDPTPTLTHSSEGPEQRFRDYVEHDLGYDLTLFAQMIGMQKIEFGEDGTVTVNYKNGDKTYDNVDALIRELNSNISYPDTTTYEYDEG